MNLRHRDGKRKPAHNHVLLGELNSSNQSGNVQPDLIARDDAGHLQRQVSRRRVGLDAKERVLLTDSRLLSVAKEWDIFIDTVARYMSGGEDIEDAKELADSLFGLVKAGARTITAAHHSPKGFERADFMSLENMVRGSGDLGAAITTAWGLRLIDAEKGQIYVKNLSLALVVGARKIGFRPAVGAR